MNLTPDEKDLPVRPFGDLRDSGLLWLINRVVFHPRGFALGIVLQDGEVTGWKLLGDGSEVWRFEDDEDECFAQVRSTFLDASLPSPEEIRGQDGLPSSSGDPARSSGDEINSAAVIFGHPNQVVAYRYVAPDGQVMVLDPADVTVILADEPNQPRKLGRTGSGS